MTLVAVLVLAGPGGSVAPDAPLVGVRVTHSHLEPVCLDGESVKPDDRNWRLHPGPHSMVFTMRNDLREGAEPHQRIAPKVGPCPSDRRVSHEGTSPTTGLITTSVACACHC
jgi:hypothetical protein